MISIELTTLAPALQYDARAIGVELRKVVERHNDELNREVPTMAETSFYFVHVSTASIN
jgi:hypothetical protein